MSFTHTLIQVSFLSQFQANAVPTMTSSTPSTPSSSQGTVTMQGVTPLSPITAPMRSPSSTAVMQSPSAAAGSAGIQNIVTTDLIVPLFKHGDLVRKTDREDITPKVISDLIAHTVNSMRSLLFDQCKEGEKLRPTKEQMREVAQGICKFYPVLCSKKPTNWNELFPKEEFDPSFWIFHKLKIKESNSEYTERVRTGKISPKKRITQLEDVVGAKELKPHQKRYKRLKSKRNLMKGYEVSSSSFQSTLRQVYPSSIVNLVKRLSHNLKTRFTYIHFIL